ncbi:MAG: protein adenylyltransferase SelO family protein [Parvularculaceae bacterium]
MNDETKGDYRPDPAFRALSPDGAPFYDAVEAARFSTEIIRYRNDRWAARVGLGGLDDNAWRARFARFEPLPDNLQKPIALRYHGHQFRVYNPDIGDGRGFLYAQLRDADGRLLDLGTKGTGRTPYSRSGDGRLTLKGAVREVLATEMLEARGVYTSKTFSVVETGEALERGDEPSPTRSAALVRLSHSHVRFGAFQRLGFEGDKTAIETLVDYCIRQFDPDLTAAAGGSGRVAAFFERVVARTARLAAQWMAAGFVHGVLNTDNMNVTGESFDYGPWRFLPRADFTFTAAYFDHGGLYAYGRQPDAAAWNLSRLGGVLALIAEEAPLNAALQRFDDFFRAGMAEAFFARLGVAPSSDGFAFVGDLLKWMEAADAPFEPFFFDWFAGPASETRAMEGPRAALYAAPDFAPIRKRLTGFAPTKAGCLSADYFAGAPCDMLIDEVEETWSAIAERNDWDPLEGKLAAIAAAREAYALDASTYRAAPFD